MQEYLNEIAAVNKCLRPIPIDGLYGPMTVTAVQQFQYLYDLKLMESLARLHGIQLLMSEMHFLFKNTVITICGNCIFFYLRYGKSKSKSCLST